jgi:hypothetical protein
MMMMIYCFTSLSKTFHLYVDVIIVDEGLQTLGLWSAFSAFEQGGMFIMLRQLWHWVSVFTVPSERPPHSSASYNMKRDANDLFYLGSPRKSFATPAGRSG